MKKLLKRPITYFVAVVLLITILFCWKEDLSISKRINDQKVSGYFTAIGSLISGFALFFLYRQLKEMQTDRSASVKPLLVPEHATFKLLENESPYSLNGKNLIKRTLIPLSVFDERPIEGEEGKLLICNSGLGPAKNVVIGWVYDRDKALYGIGEYVFEPSNLEYTQKAFLMQNEKLNIYLPSLYLTKLGRHNLKPGQNSYLDGIELKLRILYSDILDNSFSLVYNVQVFLLNGMLEFKFVSEPNP